jgi:hypothetical protein
MEYDNRKAPFLTDLGDTKELSGVAQAPVAEFVGKNGDDLVALALLNQGIVDDNVFLPGQAKEVGIAVGATLAAVNDVQLVKWELELLRQVLDVRLQLALLQGGKLVEHWQNDDGINGDHENLQTSAEHPEIVEELVASLLNDGQEPGKDRRRQGEGQDVGLDQIGNKELRSLLVKTELLF